MRASSSALLRNSPKSSEYQTTLITSNLLGYSFSLFGTKWYEEFAKGLQELTCRMGRGQDVSLLKKGLIIKHMSVKTELCLCRCVRLDQGSPERIPFHTSSPHFYIVLSWTCVLIFVFETEREGY